MERFVVCKSLLGQFHEHSARLLAWCEKGLEEDREDGEDLGTLHDELKVAVGEIKRDLRVL